MKLDYYKPDQLKAILNYLVDEHPYLAGEITAYADASGFTDISSTDLKKEVRELVAHYRNTYNSAKFTTAWQALFTKHTKQLVDMQLLADAADYATFTWDYAARSLESPSVDGDLGAIMATSKAFIDTLISKIKAQHHPAVEKTISRKFLKEATSKMGKEWDDVYWFSSAISLASGDKLFAQIRQAIHDATLYGEESTLFFLLKLREHPELEKEVPARAAANDSILRWYLPQLAAKDDQDAMLDMLSTRHQNHSRPMPGDMRDEYFELLQQLKPEAYYHVMIKNMHGHHRFSPSNDFSGWLKAHPDYQERFLADVMQDKAISNIDRISHLIGLKAWPKIADILRNKPERFDTHDRLMLFHEMYTAGLDDSQMLIEFFVTGLGHMRASGADQNEAVLRGLVEIARVAHQEQSVNAAFDQIEALYPRKYTLLDAIPEYREKINSTKLRRSSLDSVARFAFGYPDKWNWWYDDSQDEK